MDGIYKRLNTTHQSIILWIQMEISVIASFSVSTKFISNMPKHWTQRNAGNSNSLNSMGIPQQNSWHQWWVTFWVWSRSWDLKVWNSCRTTVVSTPTSTEKRFLHFFSCVGIQSIPQRWLPPIMSGFMDKASLYPSTTITFIIGLGPPTLGSPMISQPTHSVIGFCSLVTLLKAPFQAVHRLTSPWFPMPFHQGWNHTNCGLQSSWELRKPS